MKNTKNAKLKLMWENIHVTTTYIANTSEFTSQLKSLPAQM